MTIRIKIDKNGNATLSGINYSDLRSILTAASLHRRDNPFVPREIVTDQDSPMIQELKVRNNLLDEMWHKRMKNVLKMADDAMTKGIDDTLPKREPTTKQKIAKRWEKVREDQELRNLVRKAIEARRTKIQSANP